jgi:hypothetical protein
MARTQAHHEHVVRPGWLTRPGALDTFLRGER